MFAKRLRLGDGGWPSAQPVVERCAPRVPAEETLVASGGRAEELPTSRRPSISEVSDAEDDEDEDEISERRRRRRSRETVAEVISDDRFVSTPLPFDAGWRGGGGEYPVYCENESRCCRITGGGEGISTSRSTEADVVVLGDSGWSEAIGEGESCEKWSARSKMSELPSAWLQERTR